MRRTDDRAPVIIMPVEVQARELMSRIMLANRAIDRGYRVILGRDLVIRRLAPFLPKGIFFDKGLGLPRHGKPQRMAQLGYKVAALDEEGTGYYGSPEQFLSVRLAEETLAVTERWFTISDAMTAAAAAKYPSHARKFVPTGLPRTDVWRPQYRSLYDREVEAIRARHGQFILFCSNFSRIVHGRGEAFVEKQLRGQRSAYAGVEERSARIMREGRDNLEAFLAVFPKIVDWFPGHKLIVRPHPAENVMFWRDSLKKLPRTEVIQEGIASNWILASDCLIHHGCTTGIEAELMGKGHVMYAPRPDEHHDTEVMRVFAPIVKEEAELEAMMRNIVSGRALARQNISVKDRFFCSLTGKLAADKILDEFDTFKTAGRSPGKHFGLLRFHPRMLAAKLRPRSAAARAYLNQKWQGIDPNEIHRLVEIIMKAGDQTAEGDASPVVRELLPDLFELSAA